MSEGHKVLASGLKGGTKYRVRYIGPPGGDLGGIGNRVLRYRYIVSSGIPAMPRVHSFVDDTNPSARYIIPSLLASGPFDVDSRYSFTEIYEGPMASGYGPNTTISTMPSIRLPPRITTQVAPPRTNGPVGGRRRRRRTQKKTRKSRRRNRM